jgi:hypothetical protein
LSNGQIHADSAWRENKVTFSRAFRESERNSSKEKFPGAKSGGKIKFDPKKSGTRINPKSLILLFGVPKGMCLLSSLLHG